MILVDTSVWVGHFRAADPVLARRLNAAEICTHPHIVGEVALGQLRQRDLVLTLLNRLPRVVVATDEEVLSFMGSHRLYGRGVGYVDVCLLAATRLTAHARLWTLDKKLSAVAQDLGIAAPP